MAYQSFRENRIVFYKTIASKLIEAMAERGMSPHDVAFKIGEGKSGHDVMRDIRNLIWGKDVPLWRIVDYFWALDHKFAIDITPQE